MIEHKKGGAAGDQTDAAMSVPGIRDVFATVLETVTAGMAERIRRDGVSAATLSSAVVDVAGSSLRGAVATGSDLVLATKAILIGVVRSAGLKEEEGLKILSLAAKTVIHHTADRGGDLAAATKGLVLGAIAGAKALNVEIARAASTAAQGAYDGAAESGSVTAERVLTALKEPIGGSKVALPARIQIRD